MFGPFERAVAGRYLRARRGERFVSIIAIFSLVGIALGVATLIIVMSVMGGFKVDLLNRILGFNGHLGVYGVGGRLEHYDDLAAQHPQAAGRDLGDPGAGRPGAADRQRAAIPPAVTCAASPRRGCARCLWSAAISSRGRWTSSRATMRSPSASGWRASSALSVGSQLTLVSPQGAATAFGTIPRVRAYTVEAIFNVGMSQYDTLYVFLPLHAAQIFFQKPDAVSQIEVRVRDPNRVGEVSQEIRQALGDVPAHIIDWQQNNNSFFDAVQVEQNVMFLILTLIILVAAFNVISSLIMMVKDKTRDIAVLRTLGAGRGAVMRIFLMCGASVGVTGTAVGTLLGVVFCLNIQTHPALGGGDHRHAGVQSGSVLPDPPAGPAELARGAAGDADGPGAVAAGHAVSQLARRADRPGGGAAQ